MLVTRVQPRGHETIFSGDSNKLTFVFIFTFLSHKKGNNCLMNDIIKITAF